MRESLEDRSGFSKHFRHNISGFLYLSQASPWQIPELLIGELNGPLLPGLRIDPNKRKRLAARSAVAFACVFPRLVCHRFGILHIGRFRASLTVYFLSPSVLSRLYAALISARCVNACGKFPSASP